MRANMYFLQKTDMINQRISDPDLFRSIAKRNISVPQLNWKNHAWVINYVYYQLRLNHAKTADSMIRILER